MIVVVEIGGGRLPQDISAAPILWPSRPWKYPASSVFRFPPHDRDPNPTRSLTRNQREEGHGCLSLKFIRNQRWLHRAGFLLSLSPFIFNVVGYNANPKNRGGRGEKEKEERRKKGKRGA